MNNQERLSTRDKIIGALLMFVMTLCFTLASTIGKQVSLTISVPHIIFWKALTGMVLIFSMTLIKRKSKKVFKKMNRPQFKWTLIRSVVGVVLVFSMFLSFYFGEVGKLGSVINLNPIFTVFFAYLILREDINIKVIISVLVAIIGVLLIIGNPFENGFSWAYPLIMVSTIMISMETISIRKLNLMGVEIEVIAGSFMILSFIVSLPMVLSDLVSYDTNTFFLLILVGILDVIGHLCNSLAGKYLPAKMSSIFILITVFEYMILGVIFFGESVTVFNILGGILIIASSAMAILIGNSRKTKHTNHENTPPK